MVASDLNLPPGFRFHPTDDELVTHYLCPKCTSHPIAVPIITEIDLYKYDPWQLPDLARYGEKEWYFFSPRDRKYPNGSRPNRAAGSGYWKATGADKPIGKPKPMAIKKALVFYAGKAPKGEKTNWIMHEYRLADVDRSARKKGNGLRLDDWVLCRIYNKKGIIEKLPASGAIKKTYPSPVGNDEEFDRKPDIFTAPAPLPPQNPHHTISFNDYIQFDTSDSVPRIHTDSSCSEHVVSPEFTCEREREVQSQPKWKDYENTLDYQFNYMDPMVDNTFGLQPPFSSADQLSPLQDIFMFAQRPF